MQDLTPMFLSLKAKKVVKPVKPNTPKLLGVQGNLGLA